MTTDRERAIRERAYHLWAENGHGEGRDEEHWLEAERQVATAETPAEPVAEPPTKARAANLSAIEAGAEASAPPSDPKSKRSAKAGALHLSALEAKGGTKAPGTVASAGAGAPAVKTGGKSRSGSSSAPTAKA